MAKTKGKAAVAMQLKRPAGDKSARSKQQKKRKTQRTAEIVRPWTDPQFDDLPKEERDIVLDRLQKEVADVPATRSQAVCGLKQVGRAVARSELRVVVFAKNPDTLAFGHLPLLCRLHKVPICVLHLSSKTFGRLFQLKSMVAVGIKAARTSEAVTAAAGESSDGVEQGEETVAKMPVQLTEAEQKKVESITEFLISKASKRTS